jgi:hypothetical protein
MEYKVMMSRTIILDEAIQAGLTAVDFCGNVSEAIQQVAYDNETTFTSQELSEIRMRVYGKWNQSRTAAGVKTRRRAHYSESLIFGR